MGTAGCGNGLVVNAPMDHGAAKGTGPDDDVCVLVTAVAKGGFCWLRWLVKKLGLSNISAPPARITVLPLPTGSNDTPTFGENCP